MALVVTVNGNVDWGNCPESYIILLPLRLHKRRRESKTKERRKKLKRRRRMAHMNKNMRNFKLCCSLNISFRLNTLRLCCGNRKEIEWCHCEYTPHKKLFKFRDIDDRVLTTVCSLNRNSKELLIWDATKRYTLDAVERRQGRRRKLWRNWNVELPIN